MNYVFGSGSSYINYKEESTYGQRWSNNVISTTCLIRPGSMPSKSQQQIHPTYLRGNPYDQYGSIRTKSTVEGSYNFYISNSSIELLKECNQKLVDNKFELQTPIKSFNILHPLGSTNKSQLHFTGMKPSQINVSIPGDNSLAEGSISFLGQDLLNDDLNLSTTGDNDQTEANVQALSDGFFEGWSSHVKTHTQTYISVYDFSLNINNNLTAPDTLNNKYVISEPIEGLREVTGTFTIVLQPDDLTSGHLFDIFDKDSDSDSAFSMNIQMISTKNQI